MSLASRGMASAHIRKFVMAGPETWILSAAEKFWTVAPPRFCDRALVAVVETGKLHGSGRRRRALAVCRKSEGVPAGGDSAAPNFRTDKPLPQRMHAVEPMLLPARRR